ncbi:sulfite exporter TauE/SafE family protein [Actimicrobium sp. GrIS 1.19]|uniref:sulfite exporter TauE/SafE family protein n=1 Tax=Actimicrobium sp. GrIS 1.19 TaxID=3071708 RepID=UPI002E16394B
MHVITDPAFYAVAVPAVLLTSISKGGFAGGMGVAAVPLMALAISPLQAASIMLPILCVMDLTGFFTWRKFCDPVLFKRLLPGALIGILIGTLMFHHLNEAIVKTLIGVMALLFALNFWLKGRVRAPLHLPPAASAALWSTLSGFASFVSHAGGPPMMIYLLPKRLEKAILVGTLTILFTTINYAKIVPYALLGQLSVDNLATAAVLSPLAPLGVKLGAWLHDRINEKIFYRLSYGFLLLTGIKLCWDGLVHLHG